MARIYANIGSNQNRETHIRNAVRALRREFGELTVSPVYESPAFGFDGDPFFNLVIGFTSDKTIDAIQVIFNTVENANGRDRSQPRFSSRSLDIDLLLYDDLVLRIGKLVIPRPDIYTQAFVLKPLADIAGDCVDPVKKKTYRELWSQFNANDSQIAPAAIELD